MSHDQLFKDLLGPFFYQFLQLFIPSIAEGIKPEAITVLPTEVFTDIPEGEQRTGDLLTQVEPLDGPPELVLVHTEVQGEERAGFAYRMWEYNALYTLRHRKPVISIELAPFAGSGQVELVRYSRTLFGQEYACLDYWRIPLGALSAVEHVRAAPVLGAALAGLMRMQASERVDIRVAALERIAASGLDPARQFLLVNLIETYFGLEGAERTAYEQRMDRGGTMAIKDLEMTWADRMRAEGRTLGREEGRTEGTLAAKREVLLDQVRTRFGEPPALLAAQIAQRDDAWLTHMLRRVVTATSLEELID